MLSFSLLMVFLAMLTVVWWAPHPCEAHGRLMDPPARNSMWRLGYPNPVNYNDNELYCGGRVTQWARNKGQCGVCGDPYHLDRPHEVGGKYANAIITRDYQEGGVIHVVVHITANHQGYFEFRICPMDDPSQEVTQECLDRNVLQRAPSLGPPRRRYSLEGGKSNQFFNYSLLLPPGLECKHCVLQWKYRTGNTWDKDPDGTYCVGCGPQEEFYNCADVSIASRKSHSSSHLFLKEGQNPRTLMTDRPEIEYEKERSHDQYFPKTDNSHSKPSNRKSNVITMRKDESGDISKFLDKEKRYEDNTKSKISVPYSVLWDTSRKKMILLSPDTNNGKTDILLNFEDNVHSQVTKLKATKQVGDKKKGSWYFHETFDVNRNTRRRGDELRRLKLANSKRLRMLNDYRKFENRKHSVTSKPHIQGKHSKHFMPSEREILTDYINFNNAKANISKADSYLQSDKDQMFRNQRRRQGSTYKKKAKADNNFYNANLEDMYQNQNHRLPSKQQGNDQFKDEQTVLSKSPEDKKSLSPKTLLQWVLKAIDAHDSDTLEDNNKHVHLPPPPSPSRTMNRDVNKEDEIAREYRKGVERTNTNQNGWIDDVDTGNNIDQFEPKYNDVEYKTRLHSKGGNSVTSSRETSGKYDERLLQGIVKLLVQAKVLDLSKLDIEHSNIGSGKQLKPRTQYKDNERDVSRGDKDRGSAVQNTFLKSDSNSFVYVFDEDKRDRDGRDMYAANTADYTSSSNTRPTFPIAATHQLRSQLERGHSSNNFDVNGDYTTRQSPGPEIGLFRSLDRQSPNSKRNARVTIATYRGRVLGDDVIGRRSDQGGHSGSDRHKYVTSVDKGHDLFPSRHRFKLHSDNPYHNLQQYKKKYGASDYHNKRVSPLSSTKYMAVNKNRIHKPKRRFKSNNRKSNHKHLNARHTIKMPVQNDRNKNRQIQTERRQWNKGKNNDYRNKPKRRTVARGKLVCKSLVELGGGMDQWCEDNCHGNFCPQSVCACETEESSYQRHRGLDAGQTQHDGQPTIVTYSLAFGGGQEARRQNSFLARRDRFDDDDGETVSQNSYFHKRSTSNYGNPQDNVTPFRYPQHYSQARPYTKSNHEPVHSLYNDKYIQSNDHTADAKNTNVLYSPRDVTLLPTLEVSKISEPIINNFKSDEHYNPWLVYDKTKTGNKNDKSKTDVISKIKHYKSNNFPKALNRKANRFDYYPDPLINNHISINRITVRPHQPSQPTTNSRRYFLWLSTVTPTTANNENNKPKSHFRIEKVENKFRNKIKTSPFSKYEKPREKLPILNYRKRSKNTIKKSSRFYNDDNHSNNSNNYYNNYNYNEGNADDNSIGRSSREPRKRFVTRRFLSCKAVGAYRGLLGFDQWCSASCQSSTCPLLMCECA